jgi:hypothetical protein
LNPPTPQKNSHREFKNIQTKNREREIQPLNLESKRMIVASPSKENRHRAFIVKKGPLQNSTIATTPRRMTILRRGVLARISVPWDFL